MAEHGTIRADQIEGLPELIREQLKAIRQEDARPDLQDVEEVRRSPAGTTIRLEEQVKALRSEVDQRFGALESKMDQRFEALESKMDQRFEAVSQRFEAVSQRFEALESKIEQRFNDMERRFSLFQWVIVLNFTLLIAVAGKIFLMK